jgi:transcriptional regulator
MVQLLNSKMQQQQIEWRRAKVLELSGQGYSQIEIATNLQVDRSIVSRDMAYLKQKAHENLKAHIQDKLPEEYQICMVGINQVLKICWEIVNKSNMDNDMKIIRIISVFYFDSNASCTRFNKSSFAIGLLIKQFGSNSGNASFINSFKKISLPVVIKHI